MAESTLGWVRSTLRRLVTGSAPGGAGSAAESGMARNLAENRRVWQESEYYEQAEPFIRAQWDAHIWPLVKDADFSVTLDLAAGAGRNSNLLKDLAKELWIVDINQTNIDRCKARFAEYRGPCRINYAVNDGTSLSMIATGSLTMVYSFDAMVHFDPQVIRQYVREFARVMKPGATGFCHHSNYGSWAADPNSHWQSNPHWRSHMTAALFKQYCEEAGLEITRQVIHSWGGTTDLDCFSCFRKP
ncbi:MAG: hypothetical protein AMXMBFR58_14710 [Phycisphaerae bacterium]